MSGFIDGKPEGTHVFIQWKNTKACFDFHCECGCSCHFDGDFAYVMKCPKCGTDWEMPCYLMPRKATVESLKWHDPKAMEADDEDGA